MVADVVILQRGRRVYDGDVQCSCACILFFIFLAHTQMIVDLFQDNWYVAILTRPTDLLT